MTAKKISELNTLTSATSDDLLVVVDNPSGSPETKKITVANFVGNVASNTLIRGGLTVNGAVTFTNTLSVSKVSTFNANVNVVSDIKVNGTSIVNSTGYWVGSSSGLKGDKGDTGTTGSKGDKGQKGDTSSVPGPYTDDTAAAANGVSVGQMYYRSTGIVYVRLT